jgi:hypothetical protein
MPASVIAEGEKPSDTDWTSNMTSRDVRAAPHTTGIQRIENFLEPVVLQRKVGCARKRRLLLLLLMWVW